MTNLVAPKRITSSFLLISMALIGLVWAATQALWQGQGIGRDFSDTPWYVTPLRVAALLLLAFSALNSRMPNHRNPKFLLIGTFCGALTFWGFIAEYSATRRLSLNGEIYTYFAITLLSLALARKPHDLRFGVIIITRVVIWGSVTLALVFPNAAFGAGSARLAFIGSETRLSGVVGDANTLSFFALLLIAMSIGVRNKASRFDLFISVVVLALTQSRFGAILGALIIATYYLVEKRREALNFVIPLSFPIGYSVFAVGLNQRLSVTNIDGSDFWNTRLVIWQWAETTIESAPFVSGLGLTNYYQAITQSGSFWVHSHNQFLQDVLTGGYVRAVLVIALLVAMGYVAHRLAKDFVSIALVATLVLYSQVEVPLFLDSLNYRFLAVLLVIIWISDEGKFDSNRIQRNKNASFTR